MHVNVGDVYFFCLSHANHEAISIFSCREEMRAENDKGARWERTKEMLTQETVAVVVMLVMLCISLTLLVLATFLLGPNKLHYFSLVSGIFLAGPVIIIITTIPHIILSFSSLAGFIKEEKNTAVCSLIFSAFNIVMLILGLSVAVVTLSLLDTKINKINVQKSLREALEDEAVMEQWNNLQTGFSCCGGRGYTGYQDWAELMEGSVPDSCCTVNFPGCGQQATNRKVFNPNIYQGEHEG